MGERTDQIEQEIRERRNQLSDNFGELEQKLKRAVDWRAQFQQRPGTLLAVAFGGGALLSTLFAPRHSRRESHRTEPSHSSYTPSRAYATTTAPPPALNAASHSEARENLDALRGALFGVALNRVTGIIDALLPGFQQEFTRAKAGTRNYGSEPSTYRGSEATQSPDWGKPS